MDNLNVDQPAVSVGGIPVHTPAELREYLARVLATDEARWGREDYERGVCLGHGGRNA